MIKINLLSEKKKKSIPIPIGGIVVVLWIIANAGVLFWYKDKLERELAEYRQPALSNLESKVRRLDQEAKTLRRLQQEKSNYAQALADYSGILSKKTGSWTKVLRRFEEFIAKAKTVWILQLRIDPEGLVQLTGVSKGAEIKGEQNADRKTRNLTTQGIRDLIEILNNATDAVSSVNLSEVQPDTLEKHPVSKFELTFQITKD
jgi:hypothetical protein